MGMRRVALQNHLDSLEGVHWTPSWNAELPLSDLLAPLMLGLRAITPKELALMDDLIPLLHKLAQGREISGLGTYE